MTVSQTLKNPMYLAIIALVVIAALIAVYLETGSAAGAQSSKVATGDNVSVFYTLTLTNGTVLQSNFGQQPFVFTAGSNEVIQGFDQAVMGMAINQTRNVTIPANEAYGPINPQLFVRVPLSEFGNHTVQAGMPVTQTSGGQQTQGIITAVNSTTAIVDFNSPLAGKTLIFTIKVVGIHKGST